MSTPMTSVSGCSSAEWCELLYVRQKVGSTTKVDCPYSGATANIKSSVDVFDWRIAELLIQGEPNNVVLEICAISNVVFRRVVHTPKRSRSSYSFDSQSGGTI
jgi:hypothetical protein